MGDSKKVIHQRILDAFPLDKLTDAERSFLVLHGLSVLASDAMTLTRTVAGAIDFVAARLEKETKQ